MAMNSERDQQFQALIRKLVSCQQDSGRLGLIFLGQLINMAVLETALESLSPDTRFAVAQDISGAGELIRSLPISMWKKGVVPVLDKLPAVFLIG